MTDDGQIVGPLMMGLLADAIDLSTPFVFGAVLLAAMAWQGHRRGRAIANAITVEGSGS